MHVAICIVGFRNPDDIQACLAALGASAHDDFEVIICENGGAAAAEDLKRIVAASLLSKKTAVVCAPGNLGYAGGVNLCMDHTPKADAWWILNPDTSPTPEALARMCARLAAGDCDAVGCTVYYPSDRVESRGGRWIPWLARAVALDHGEPLSSNPDDGQEADLSYLSGASMLVGRSFLERAGRMRNDYFLYGEEVEWCLRGRARGLRLGMAGDANVLHKQGTTTGSVSDVAARKRMPVFLDERNKLLITRDCFPALLPVTALGALAMLFLRFGRRGAWRQLGYALQGWWSGLIGQRGKPGWVAST